MDDAQLARRFGVIEQQVRIVSEQLGVDCPPFASDGLAVTATESSSTGASGAPGEASPSGLPAEVVDLARAGHATQAISLLRHLTGASLIEAKRAVDNL